MPKAGFKSITVSDYVYNRFFGTYERTRKDLELKGITSFSGYLTSMMDDQNGSAEELALETCSIYGKN